MRWGNSASKEQWEDNIFKDVLYVLGLRRNLFSEGAITHLGFVITKRNTNALIYKNNKVVLIASQKSNNLYEMNLKTMLSASCNTVQTDQNGYSVHLE